MPFPAKRKKKAPQRRYATGRGDGAGKEIGTRIRKKRLMLKTASLRFYPLDSQLPLEIFAVLHSDFPTARVAVVLHREPDLNDAVEDTSPRVICRGVQDSLAKVEVRRYHHRFPCLVASVDNVVDVLHDVLGGALGTEVFKDEEVWGEDSLKVPGTLLEGGFHQVHDLLDIGHETGEPALDDGVRDAGRMEALARAALPVQDKPLRVFWVEGRGKCLADGALSRVPAVIGIEGAEGVPAG